MHSKIKLPQLPFLTREMLKWGSRNQLELTLSVAASNTGEVFLTGLTRSGVIRIKLNPSADGVLSQKTIGIDDIPIMLSVIDPDGNHNQSSCWASVELRVSKTETLHLCSGTVYQQKGITYPATSIQDIVPGRGFIAEVSSANPAAGAEALITAPAGELWHVLYGTVTLVTDATSTNRRVHLKLNDNQTTRIDVFTNQDQTASLTRRYSFSQLGVIQDPVDGDDIPIAIPNEIWIEPEGQIETDTVNLQAGDDFGAMSFLVEKFFGRS